MKPASRCQAIEARLLRFLVPFRWSVLLATVLGAAVIASNMGLLGVAAYLIAAAATWHLLILLLVPIYLVRTLSVTRGLARYAERLVAHNVTFRILSRIRIQLYDRLSPLGFSLGPALHSGDTLSRLTADVDELQNAYLRFVTPVAVSIPIVVLLAAILHLVSDSLAVVAVLYLLAAGAGLPALVYLLSRGLGRRHVSTKGDLNGHLIDTIQGVQDILSLGTAETQLGHVATLDRVTARIEDRLAVITAGREGIADLLGNLAVVTVLALTVRLVTAGIVSSLYLAVPALLVLAGFEIVRPLGAAAQSIDRTRAAGARVFAIGERLPVVTETAMPVSPPETGAVRFDRVTFTYPGNTMPTLHDITFAIPSGARLAVVGPSGAGKTSLAQLLVRGWDPSHGAISLDGRDIREYRLADLRAAVALVSQDTHIFNDTIRKNLLLAHQDATERAMMDALTTAQLAEFVHTLPDGLDTALGEHGMRLSGGERQRLAIARALLKDAPLLVLDEATANLDPMTEEAVLGALDTVMLGRTTIMITHRLVLMERMDEILVLDRGQIVERGTHRELLTANDLYRRMVEVQESMLPG